MKLTVDLNSEEYATLMGLLEKAMLDEAMMDDDDELNHLLDSLRKKFCT